MTNQPLSLTALVGSRICHDLISPLGAISNGVELLGMDGGPQTPEMELIAQSVESANARIRFFRVAYGAASPGHTLVRSEIASVLADLSKGARLSYDWHPVGNLPRSEVKLAFLLLQCLESSMPYGGTVRITKSDEGWSMIATAPKLKADPAIWALTAGCGEVAEITPALVHFALIPDALRATGCTLFTELGDNEIIVRF